MNPLCSRGRRLRAPVVLIVAGLLAVAAPGGQPAGPPDPTPERGMTETLDVDLKADPRPRFEVRGAVAWEAGKLTLNSGGKLRRKVAVGSDARLTLALTFAPLDTDGQKSTTRFAFQVRDRGEFVAVMTRQRADGRTKASVRLVDQDTPFQMADVTRTIRTFELDGDLPSGAWTFRHHHGLVTVYCDGTRIGVGYSDKEPGQYSGNPRSQLPNNPEFYRYFGVDEPLEVVGWRLEQQGVPLVCGAISGAASESYKAKLAASFPEKARKYGRAVKAFSPSEENGDLRARTEGPLTGGANREFLHFE